MEVVRVAEHRAREFGTWSMIHRGLKSYKSVWVGWEPPENGWLKLNTDGARKASTGLANAGGLVRDHAGNWIWDYIVNIGHTDSFTVELWGLRDGLRLLDGKGFSRVVVELDSEAVITVFKEGIESESRAALAHDCIKIAKRNKIEFFQHVIQEENKCADWLANLGQTGSWGTTFWESPTEGIRPLLGADASGARVQRVH